MKKVLSLVLMLGMVLSASLCFAEFDLGETSLGSGMDIHGYYEFEYWDTQGERETFDAHKITIWMGKAVVPDKVFVSGEFEWEHFPRHNDAAADEAGGDGEIKLDSAQVSITPNNTCRAYVGVFYVPFGIEYESYPGHKNKLITRPIAFKGGKSIVPGTWSDVGIGFEHKIPSVGKIDVYAVNGDAVTGGVSRDNKAGGNSAKSIGARISLDGLAEGINVGASYVSGRYSADGAVKDLDSERIGVHLRAGLPVMGLTLITEYVQGTDDDASAVATKDAESEGLYVQLSIEPVSGLELVARYDEVDADTEVKAANRDISKSVGIGYALYDHLKLKAEYQANGNPGADGVAGKDDVVVVGLVADW